MFINQTQFVPGPLLTGTGCPLSTRPTLYLARSQIFLNCFIKLKYKMSRSPDTMAGNHQSHQSHPPLLSVCPSYDIPSEVVLSVLYPATLLYTDPSYSGIFVIFVNTNVQSIHDTPSRWHNVLLLPSVYIIDYRYDNDTGSLMTYLWRVWHCMLQN